MTLRIMQIEEDVIGFFANNTIRVLDSFSYHTCTLKIANLDRC